MLCYLVSSRNFPWISSNKKENDQRVEIYEIHPREEEGIFIIWWNKVRYKPPLRIAEYATRMFDKKL